MLIDSVQMTFTAFSSRCQRQPPLPAIWVCMCIPPHAGTYIFYAAWDRHDKSPCKSGHALWVAQSRHQLTAGMPCRLIIVACCSAKQGLYEPCTGNFKTLDQAIRDFSADGVRIALAAAGDAMADANFEFEVADKAVLRLTKELAWIEKEIWPALDSLRTGHFEFLDEVFVNELSIAAHDARKVGSGATCLQIWWLSCCGQSFH